MQPGFKDEARRRELAEFLRSRRMRLTPARAGLQSVRRRCTPGLRREEVAELAGVGPSWYTWLEQARDIRPSEITLRGIARALRLTKAEARYLLELGLECAPQTTSDEVVTPELVSIVRGIHSPALVLGRLWDIVARNSAACALWDLDHAPSRNFLALCFAPQAQAMYPNLSQWVGHEVALFRARSASLQGHPEFVEFVSQLEQRSPLFRELWDEREVSDEMFSGHVTMDHPFVGRLTFAFEFLGVLESPSLMLKILVCDGVETTARCDALVRQLELGEHGPGHNVWTALAPPRAASAS
jgi:transcriptional regulator with XRE-family HTH domain